MITFSQFMVEATSPLKSRLISLRSKMAEAAQKIYDEWDPDDEDNDFGGGICDSIAEAIQGVIGDNIPNVEMTDGGHDGDDHAWTIVMDDTEAFGVDIPAHVYERGGGYSWEKIDGVQIDANDVNIFDVDRKLVVGESKEWNESTTITKDEYDRYAHGDCWDFAVAAHEITGWPTYGAYLTEEHDDGCKGDIVHAVVQVPNKQDTYLDVSGLISLQDIKDRYDTETLEMKPVRAGYILGFVWSQREVEEAKDVVQRVLNKYKGRLPEFTPQVTEIIRQLPDGHYRLYSRKKGKDGKRKNLGTYPTRAGAEKRERQVQYWKHHK